MASDKLKVISNVLRNETFYVMKKRVIYFKIVFSRPNEVLLNGMASDIF